MLKTQTSLLIASCLWLFACSAHNSDESVDRDARLRTELGLSQIPPKLFKVAFVGDSGHGHQYRKTLNLMKQEGVDLVLHLGDLGYDEHNQQAPKLWDEMVTEVFGKDFPYLFVVGNHDLGHWNKEPNGYATLLKRRLQANKEINCVGEGGVKAYCNYRGLFFVMSGIGTLGKGHEDFIAHALSQAKDFPWRVCAWHKNQREMQAGHKSDEVGWTAYRHCQEFGAMIATGHEHSYSRTRTLQDLGNRDTSHGAIGDPGMIELDKGKTFAFVSGLGGHSLRPFDCSLHYGHKWWATVFTENFFMVNGAIKYSECDDDDRALRNLAFKPPYTYGALFVTFHYQDDPRLAKAEFKTIENKVIDSFLIRTNL